MNIFQMSLQGAVLIIVILLIRIVFNNLLPKKTFLILWDIAFARLLIPFSLPSSVSFYSLVQRLYTRNTNTIFTLYENSTTQQNTNSFGLIFAVGIVGTIIFASIFLILYFIHRRSFNTSLPVSNSYVSDWLSKHKIARKIQVRQSDEIHSPLTYGIFNPVILLPKNTDWENEEQMNFVLLHEFTHIRQFHSVLKLIAIIVLCLHWFNPLVWVMYFAINRDIELYCDECVVKACGEKSKSSYALTLINMEERKSTLRPFCSNYSKTAIEERIVSIMKIKKISIFSIAIATALIITTAAAFTTTAATKTETDTTSVSESTSVEATENNGKNIIKQFEDNGYNIIKEFENSEIEYKSGDGYYLEKNNEGFVEVIDEESDEVLAKIMTEADAPYKAE